MYADGRFRRAAGAWAMLVWVAGCRNTGAGRTDMRHENTDTATRTRPPGAHAAAVLRRHRRVPRLGSARPRSL